MLNRVSADSVFCYFKDIELIFAAQNILLNEPNHKLCSDIYGPKAIASLKKKYHFLDEVFRSFGPYHGSGILEHLLFFPLEGFTLARFQEYLLSIEPAQFLKQHLAQADTDLADIQRAIADDAALETLYFNKPDLFSSFLGCQTFFRQTRRYINEYFALAEDLRTEAFLAAIKAAEPAVMHAMENTRTGLESMPPLEWSQQIMGKTFYNRGPYESFVFSPSLLLPYRALRFFGDNQILFFSIRPKSIQDEDILMQLKVIADSTRFKIISLLGEKGPLRGMDIAEAFSVAPSTISHHMEQLKKAGLLNEEQVKNSKYYSINKNSVNELLKRLTETLAE